jgi:coenzyme F420-0:L-glutamate ligase / coenzyme F420-1:gamma-L-glutamate ligase
LRQASNCGRKGAGEKLVAPQRIEIIALPGMPEIVPGADLPRLIAGAMKHSSIAPQSGDTLVVAQKIVSKAEGRLVSLDSAAPSERAREWAKAWNKDARLIELVLRESKRIVRMQNGIIVSETPHGFVCANAGIDVSNAPDGMAILLPLDSDASARRLREEIFAAFAVDIGVIVSDTFGRPWREGLVNVALGVSGLSPLIDYRGERDGNGKTLQATVIATADEIASAAELVMGKADRVPAAIVRGLAPNQGEGTGRDLIRAAEKDLFR